MCSWICMDSKIDLIHKDIFSQTSDIISMAKIIFSSIILRIHFEITYRQAKECILHTFSTFVFVPQLRLKQYTSKCTMIIFLRLCPMEAEFETIAIYMYLFNIYLTICSLSHGKKHTEWKRVITAYCCELTKFRLLRKVKMSTIEAILCMMAQIQIWWGGVDGECVLFGFVLFSPKTARQFL